jgi:hypothetical protein
MEEGKGEEGGKEEAKEVAEAGAKPGWVRSLLETSSRFCSFILG